MDSIKVIKTEADYEKALVKIEELIDQEPTEDSAEADQLEVLAMLAEKYEEEHFPVNLPDPISAIEFRMDQLDMKPVDLEPYIGPLSRISEVLSGKRPLTKKMVQSLESGLGIPAKVLLSKKPNSLDEMIDSWPKKLIGTMEARGYFVGINGNDTRQKLRSFFNGVGAGSNIPAMLRQSGHRLAPTTDKYAKAAWSARVVNVANETQTKGYAIGSITPKLMRSIAKLSIHPDGPLRAQKSLENKGVVLVFEPHLPKTRLDGAVLRSKDGRPIVGLTLRHNRLDNFWFTLMHELAHISLHYDSNNGQFWDELQIKGLHLDDKENEADKLAQQTLVPDEKWDRSNAKNYPTEASAQMLADDLGVDITIVVGRIRFESQDWTILSSIANKRTIIGLFPDIRWEVET